MFCVKTSKLAAGKKQSHPKQKVFLTPTIVDYSATTHMISAIRTMHTTPAWHLIFWNAISIIADLTRIRKSISFFPFALFLCVAYCSGPVLAEDFCYDSAGEHFGIPPALLQALSYVESRHDKDAVHRNENGTFDYGHMQINTIWVKQIGESYLALSDPCYCTYVGAWILSQCIEKHGYSYDALSCYRSGRALNALSGKTKEDVLGYIGRVKKRFDKLTPR
jgi:soluble lytic murein transglycosylase-like protein